MFIASSANSQEERKAIIKELKKLNVPYVSLDSSLEDSGLNEVTFDNVKGGYEATAHLINDGYYNIGMITTNTKSRSGYQRFLGYKKALAEHNIELDMNKVRFGIFDIDTGYENAFVMFSNHLIMLIKRLQEKADLNEYYFEDKKQIARVRMQSIAISELILYDLFSKYKRELTYSEVILCAMHIEMLLS